MENIKTILVGPVEIREKQLVKTILVGPVEIREKQLVKTTMVGPVEIREKQLVKTTMVGTIVYQGNTYSSSLHALKKLIKTTPNLI